MQMHADKTQASFHLIGENRRANLRESDGPPQASAFGAGLAIGGCFCLWLLFSVDGGQIAPYGRARDD